VKLYQWLMLVGGLAAAVLGYLIGFGKIRVPEPWHLVALPMVLGGAALLMAFRNETDVNP
jgi:hypothetical protein